MRFRAETHLRRPAEFSHVRQIGRRHFGGAFTLWVAPRPDASPPGPRIGFVASRSAVGNAVQRNRAKRRMREIFRHHQALVAPDHDLVMVARSSINRLDYAAIERKFVQACALLFPRRPSS